MSSADATLFPGFESRRIATTGAEIDCVIGGSGPPLLLLHGYPQTHAMWHTDRAAPRGTVHRRLQRPARLRRLVEARQAASAASITRSGRWRRTRSSSCARWAFPRFRLAGHDRGGRVAHRLCVDHPEAVERVAVLDISPTRIMYGKTDKGFATAYYHWFFLIQPFDLPEKLIGADPIYYLRKKTGGWGSAREHLRSARLRRVRTLLLEDRRRSTRRARTIAPRRRSTSSTTTADIAAGRKVTCPLLVLWGDKGVVHRYFDPVADWRSVATDVRGRALPSGHYLAEEAPEETLAELSAFFSTERCRLRAGCTGEAHCLL